jgi:AraC-like DNA-binding protein
MNENLTLRLREVLVFAQKSERVRQSPRPFCALSFKASVGGAYVVEGERITYEKGALCLVPAGVAYRRESEREDIYVIHFDADGILPQTVRTVQVSDIAACSEKFAAALAFWERKGAGDYYRASAILHELFAEVITPEESAAHESDYLARSVQYMERALADHTLTIGKLAARAFVSPANFRRRFAARYGCSPKQYLDRLRMTYAQDLLQTGYYSAAEVAERCGFADAGYFCTAFRRYTGESVSDFCRRFTEI